MQRVHTRRPRPARTAFPCEEVGCFEVATICVRVNDIAEQDLCPIHFSDLRNDRTVRRHVVRQLDRPACFKDSCGAAAVSVMPHLDGTALPVCERHLEDLSWVSPTAVELQAMDPTHD
jgi:hypothetical protein